MTLKNNSTNSKIKITVIINVYNGEKYIKRAINSILEQTYKPFEIIVWDNCSTDNTALIVQEYSYVKYFRSLNNTTLGQAREEARKLANGNWISYLDCDDFWYNNKLEDQINYVDSSVGLIYSGVDEIDVNGNLINKRFPLYKSGFMLAEQLTRFDIDMVTPLINNKLLNKYHLGFNPIMVASEEQDLFLKICAKSKIISINKIHAASTIREDSLTNKSIKFWAKEREITLNALEKILDNNKYSKEIFKARLQAKYYKARYLAERNKFNQVRKIMRNLIFFRKTYFFLYLISFSPWAWKFIHKRSLKVILTKFFKINA